MKQNHDILNNILNSEWEDTGLVESDCTQGHKGDVVYRVYGTGYGALSICVFPIIRQTPTGAVASEYGKEHFICWSWRKQWACRTKEEALESFRRRKLSQIDIARDLLRVAEQDLELVKKIIDDTNSRT